MRRIGVLMNTAAENAQGRTGVSALLQVLQQLGWTEGRNLRIDIDGARTMSSVIAYMRQNWLRSRRMYPGKWHIERNGGATCHARYTNRVRASLRSGRSWTCYSVARPGSNATGFMNFEYSLSGKWLELLKEIAPQLARAAVVRNPANPASDRSVRCHSSLGAVAAS